MSIFKFAEKREAPPQGEVAGVRGENIYRDFMDRSVNPNDFFEQEGRRTLMEQTRIMEDSDPHLFGLMQTRQLAILGFERQIVGGDEAVQKFVQEAFARINNFDWILFQILSGIKVGFSVAEIIWQLEGKVFIEDIRPRNQDRFVFDKEWNLKLLKTNVTDAQLVPEKKFLVFTYMGEFGNKYGSALYQKLYWYWYFKKHSTQFWSIYTEKFASPTVIARTNKKLSNTEYETIDAFINGLKNHSGIRVSEEVEFTLLEAQRQGALASYETFLNWLKNGMAIAILGQPGTIEDSRNGSYAKVVAQDEVRQDILKADISFVESVINDYLVKWLVDFNFDGVKEYPKWKIVYEEKPDPRILAEVVQILVNAGHPIPQSFINRKFGIPAAIEGEPVLTRQPAPTFGLQPTFAEMQFKHDREAFEAELKRK